MSEFLLAIDSWFSLFTDSWFSLFGALFYVFGVFLTQLNLYFAFVRDPLNRFLGQSKEEYRYVSGIPLVGSLSLYLSAGLLYEYPVWIGAAILTSLLDPWGIPWAVVIGTREILFKPGMTEDKPDNPDNT